MSNIFSKERRGEDGDIVQTVLIIAIFVVIVGVVGNIMYKAIEMKTGTGMANEQMADSELSPHERNTKWVTDVSTAIEEWSVANPAAGIPATDDYILYDDYKKEVVKSDSFPVGDNTYIKVVPNKDQANSFTVCGYATFDNDIDLKDMDIYGFNTATGVAEPQTRGVCLL